MVAKRLGNDQHRIGAAPSPELQPVSKSRPREFLSVTLLLVNQRRIDFESKRHAIELRQSEAYDSPKAVPLINKIRGKGADQRVGCVEECCVVEQPNNIRIASQRPVESFVYFSNGLSQDAIHPCYGARDHSRSYLRLHSRGIAHAAAKDGDLMSKGSHCADHRADMHRAARL